MSFEYVILGVAQGIFEWLPISSEGVISLLGEALKIEMNVVDTALFLHLGTALASLVYFKKEWKEIILLKNRKMVRMLLIVTPISLLVGLPVYKLVRSFAIGNSLLFLTGFALLVTAYFHKKKLTKKMGDVGVSIVTGLVQGLAAIPGVSRSGSTIFGISLGEEEAPEEILKMSYILSLPIVLASSIYLVIFERGVVMESWIALPISFIVGMITLSWLLRVTRRVDFFWFVVSFSLLCFIGGLIGMVV